jgi:Tol biopolymer transport system component
MEGYYRYPSVGAGGSRLIFTSDSSIWLATLPADLSTMMASPSIGARRITPGGSGAGCATFGTLSRDGRRVAMVSTHEGGAADLYELPTEGASESHPACGGGATAPSTGSPPKLRRWADDAPDVRG